jgi:hypothetical protein
MINTSVQQSKMIFAYMLKKPKYLLQIGAGFFEHEDLQYIAMIAKNFYKQYKESPTKDQIKLIIEADKREIPNDVIDSYFDVDIDSMDRDWLKDTTEGWIRFRSLMTNFTKAATLIKTSDVSLENVQDVVRRATDIVSETNLVTFDKNLGVDFFNPENHHSTVEEKIPFTWDYWNKSSNGGLDPKTLHAYIGGTNIGKCCSYSTKVKIRNKKTGEIKEISIGDLFKLSQH